MYDFRMLILILAMICLPLTVLAEENAEKTAEALQPKAETDVKEVSAEKAETKIKDSTVSVSPVEEVVKAKEQETDAELPVKSEKDAYVPIMKARVYFGPRVAVGMLGSDMVAEYGAQIEVTSKHFGLKAYFANFQPYPDTVDFCYDFGFAFHYYHFGNGPSGLYFGPGFTFMQMFQDGDPMRGVEAELRKQSVLDNLEANPPADGVRLPPADPTENGLIVNHRTGYGRQFNLLTPTFDLGFRHSWPEHESIVYFTAGIELTVGYAISDQANYWDSGFIWMLNPQLGATW